MSKGYGRTIGRFFLGIIALGTAVCFVSGGVFLLWASTLTMPTIDIIEAQRNEQSTKIYDRTGEVLLYDMHQDVRRTVVPLKEMSDNIKHATIAIEDDGFYHHYGIDPAAIIRAIVRNLQAGDLLGGQGGSTLTQQVVKNTLLVSEKKISRKLKEWVLAVKLERELSKDEILELYLNEAPYGGTKYGIEEASQGFFGKSANDLTVAESAYLAALPQAPTYYSPYGNNKEALEERKKTVLARMYEQNYIEEDVYNEALAETVEFRPFTSATIKAPHFVFYVIEQLLDIYGEKDLAQANLRVITTLDWELQREAERIILAHALENTEKYNATNASLMALDPRTGEILVMVGSRDYFDDEVDGNYNIGLAERQPGSSFKPFAYAAALQKGYTTETILYDVRTQFSTNCNKTNLTSEDGCYSPGNYDNKFRGPMTIREALAQSVNIPAVKAVYLAGMRETVELAKSMGVSTLKDAERYGLTLVLGGGEVSLLEMTGAYGVFAAEGKLYPKTGVLEVRDGSGKTIQTHEPKSEEIFERNIALSITDILADNIARTPAFGANSYLHFPHRDVAVKTGTTNDYRDAWIIGYTPTIAVGAWAGNNNNSAMEKKVAGFIVAPMWNEFLIKYFELHEEVSLFEDPEPLTQDLKPILLGHNQHGSQTDVATSTTTNTIDHSILHYVDKHDPLGPIPNNPSFDPQYPYWEYGVILWRLSQGTLSIEEALDIRDDSDELENVISVHIKNPEEDEQFRVNERVRVRSSVDDDVLIKKVEYFVDGVLLESRSDEDSYSYEFIPKKHSITKGDHILMVIVYDEEGRRGGSTVDFVVR